MPKLKFAQKPMPIKPIIPFVDAEEAWFWYIRAERERRSGNTQAGRGELATRPCEPDDIYRFVMKLRYLNLLSDMHLRVMAKFGWRESPPDPRLQEEAKQVTIWEEAFRHLTPVLSEKGLLCHG